MAKQAARLPKKKKTEFRFQKLKMCKKCQRYSVIKEESCPVCGSTYMGVESLARSILKNRVFSETMFILIFVCAGIIFSPTLTMRYYSLIASLVFAICYLVLMLIFIKSEYYTQLKQLFFHDLKRIKAGIQSDSNRAKTDVSEGQVAAGYDKLREICDLIDNDQLKNCSVKALNEIALRKDMELEIEQLIPSSYDKDFVKYALEVQKINRMLVTKKVISYFSVYRDGVVRDFGIDSLITVLDSALRMKLYIHEFSEFIQEYIDYFPKERILRLCRIVNAHPEEDWGSLADTMTRMVAVKFHYDPDFMPYIYSGTSNMKTYEN
ncbi:hypothetical protein BTR25_23310 [Bacillus sp. MRMR6]|nr:hypothetical protein BTR25_23310 [Bacillus sp. MRMR6]